MAKSATTTQDGNIALNDADFHRASEMVNRLTGIVIKEHKREMIQSRLSRRLRALGIATYGAYLDFVQSDAGKGEIGEFINVVTTNLTSFYRESHHFDDLKNVSLPQAMATNPNRVRIWSSACSSGEEPYSIAMTVQDSVAATCRDLKILATDLDTNILARAAAGIYKSDKVSGIPADQLAKHTTKGDGEYRFNAQTKAAISFRNLNLLEKWPFAGPFDIIFCRNVLIYFNADVKRQLVDRMTGMIRPGGTLYLGHSESLLGEHPQLKSEGKTIYRRLP